MRPPRRPALRETTQGKRQQRTHFALAGFVAPEEATHKADTSRVPALCEATRGKQGKPFAPHRPRWQKEGITRREKRMAYKPETQIGNSG
jgi:hypothetical protein